MEKKNMDFKLKKELKFGDGASFMFGISDSGEIEGWNKGFNLISDWSYLESDELNSSILKIFRKRYSFKKVLWTVHYKLNRI